LTSISEFVCDRIPIIRNGELFVADGLAILPFDFFNRLMVHNLDTDCVVRLSVDWLLLASTEAEWSQIYPVGALLLVGVGLPLQAGLRP